MSAATALASLTERPIWVAWRGEKRGDDVTKVPYSPHGKARADDPATWVTRPNAEALAKRIVNGLGGGVGVEFCEIDADRRLGGVDLDTCRNPKTGEIEPWAREIVDRFASYAEVSPSGTGAKVFFTFRSGDLAEFQSRMGAARYSKEFKRAGGKHPPAIELHLANRYFTVTEQHLDGTPIDLRHVTKADILWLLTDYGPRFASATKAAAHDESGNDNSRSAAAFRLGARMRREGATYGQFIEACRTDPEAAEWCRAKGEANGQRELKRIWERSAEQRKINAEPWPEPFDFLAENDLTGTPELKPEHLPPAITGFVFDTAERMGADPAAVALAALTALASVADDGWHIQPKQNDTEWTEQPRIWGAIVGDPSIRKTPILKACTKPIDKLEIVARERHDEAMRRYRTECARWKKDGADPEDEPKAPTLDRYMVESTTVEALSEVLRSDFTAPQRVPAHKVLARQDELTELVSNFDRYRSGGRGGGDRGAFLRLYNGGRFTVDRIGRGSFASNNWSACLLGGIQPEPIRRIAAEAADDGLLQRFCFCVPPRQGREQDAAPNVAAITRYKALFPALAALHPPEGVEGEPHRHVVLHRDVQRHRLYVLDLAGAVASMPDASPRLKSALGKWPGLFPRLALIFHLIEIADARASERDAPDIWVVSPETAARAADYMQSILLPHLLRADAVMFASAQTGHAQWIAGYILAHGIATIGPRDVVRAYGALRAPEHADELGQVLAGLAAFGWLRATDRPTRWLVNPAVHTRFAARAAAEKATRNETQRRVLATLTRRRSQEAA